MGLDMYLYKEKTFFHFEGLQKKLGYSQVAELIGYRQEPSTKLASARMCVGYWRKANAIHDWFVREVQGGKDECKPHDVSLAQLLELKRLCLEVLVNRGEEDFELSAKEKLPPASGFFFGSTEVDEWYQQDLEYTVELVERLEEDAKEELESAKKWIKKTSSTPPSYAPEDTVTFIYQSSW